VARKKKTGPKGSSAPEAESFQDRLKLIKKRHWELIVRPRQQILDGMPTEDEEDYHPVDDAEEMQLLEEYTLEADV